MSGTGWSSTVFLLLAPDAIARHLAIPLLERISAEGFVPVAYRPVAFPPPDLDALYERNIRTVWDAYRFRLVDLLFSYGPMLVVLLEDTVGDPGRNGHERLKDLKGDSDPLKAGPGTLRREFWAINVTMSLLHASDSPADAEYESSLFLGPAPPIPVTSEADLFGVCRLLSPATPEQRRFDEVLGGFRSRVVAAVWDDLSTAGRDLALGWEAQGGPATLARPGAGRELAEHLSGGAGHPVAKALSCEFTPDHPKEDLTRLQHLLRAFGVHVDRWEELVLTTSMTWRPRRAGDG